jgi:hypothetical protein
MVYVLSAHIFKFFFAILTLLIFSVGLIEISRAVLLFISLYLKLL